MGRLLSRSYQEQDVDSIAAQRRLQFTALRSYFGRQNPALEGVFPGYSSAQLEAELANVLSEVDLQASLSILSALEASFRIDFAVRCEKRHKDYLSVHFRRIFKKKGHQVHFEDDIISGWQAYTVGANTLLSELRQATKFRHWLAHGRYWIVKANIARFTFNYLYSPAQTASESLDFHLD